MFHVGKEKQQARQSRKGRKMNAINQSDKRSHYTFREEKGK